MKFDSKIKELYGSVDQMLKATETTISRSYIYQIINGEKKNISVEVARELVRILKLNSIEELMELINESEEIQ